MAHGNLRAIADSIKAEGLKLYRSELASWKAADVLTANYKDDLSQVGGYFSFGEDGYEKCVFFSREAQPKVLMTVVFDSSFDIEKASVSMMKHAFTPPEAELYALRKAAGNEMEKDSAFFRRYEHTQFNLVPVAEGSLKKVYILTATGVSETAIFGNDYLLTFDSNNHLIDKERLHTEIQPAGYGSKADTSMHLKNVGTIHYHLQGSGNFMTATDICTFMLYADIAKWPSCVVVSEHYTSIWQKNIRLLLIINK